MSGIEWRGDLVGELRAILAKTQVLDDDLADGATAVLDESNVLIPKESGDLMASGRIQKDRSGTNAVAITFDGPYARWIHEHMGFKHPRGGQAKFLETALLTKGKAAINAAGEHLWRRL